MLTGRRFRVEFSEDQAEFAERIGAVCRAVWNTGLEQRREYRRRGAWMNYRPQARELAQAKAEHRWLAQVPGHCLQQTLMDLDKACRTHGTFRVRWRSGRRWAPSFRFPEGSKMAVEKLNARHGRVKLPKLGWVTFRMSRPLDAVVIRSATVAREGRHWFVSLLVDDGKTTPQAHAAAGVTVGVDRGVAAGDRHQRRGIGRPRVPHRGREAADGGVAAQAFPRGAAWPQSGQDPCGTCADSVAGASPPCGLLRPDRSPVGHQQCGSGARRPQDTEHDPFGERNPRQTRDECASEVRAQSRHPGQGMAPVRPGTALGGPLHRDDGGQSVGGVHVATLLGVWASGSEIPREPSGIPVHHVRTQ